MSDPIEDYCRALRRELGGATDLNDVMDEVEDHLRETAGLLITAGSAPDDASREATRRFGSAESVSSGLRSQHGFPRGSDPAPASRPAFALTAGLLVLAAAAAAAAIYVHWLPCAGEAIATEVIRDACLTRMDTAWAFPFAPEAGERSLAADGFRLAGLLLLALAGVTLGLGQPWQRRVRWAILAPTLPILAMATDTIWLIADPWAEPNWWTTPAMLVLDVLVGVALLAIVGQPASLDESSGTPKYTAHAHAATSYAACQWRAALLMLGVSAPSLLHMGMEYAVMRSISDLNWDTPPHTGYIAAGSIAACAIGSLLVGRFAKPPATLDEQAGEPCPGPAALSVPGVVQ